MASKPTGVSRGTLRARFKSKNGALKVGSVYFTPDCDYCVKHREKLFAVFVSGSRHCTRQKICNNSVPLKCANDLSNVVATAAATHARVEIEVADGEIVTITIPDK